MRTDETPSVLHAARSRYDAPQPSMHDPMQVPAGPLMLEVATVEEWVPQRSRWRGLVEFLGLLATGLSVLGGCAAVWGLMLVAAWAGPWLLPTLIAPLAVSLGVVALARTSR